MYTEPCNNIAHTNSSVRRLIGKRQDKAKSPKYDSKIIKIVNDLLEARVESLYLAFDSLHVSWWF